MESTLSPLARAGRIVSAIAADPIEFGYRVQSDLLGFPEQFRTIPPYIADPDWDASLHAALGVPFPCGSATDLMAVWSDIAAALTARGIEPGPMSYLEWNDGDLGLLRAIWCLIRHRGATRVVETGVGHGVTSRCVLEALARNGGGHLWSIDLPPQLRHEKRAEIGVAVRADLRPGWTYLEGSSRRHLSGLLHRVGPIDLFIHDSKHSAENVLFELRTAWPALRPGGVAVVDDIDANDAFHTFRAEAQGCRAWVCEAEPVRPDERRSNKRGYFGILLKPA